MRKACIVLGIAIIMLMLDLGLTSYFLMNYYDIVSEGNLLLNEFDPSNFMLVLVLNISYLVLIFVTARYLFRYKTIMLEAKNMHDYVKKMFLSDHYKFIMVCMCFMFITSTFASRFVVICDWIVFGAYKASYLNTFYFQLRQFMPMQRYDVIVMFFVAMISVPVWFYIEYLKSNRNQVLGRTRKI